MDLFFVIRRVMDSNSGLVADGKDNYRKLAPELCAGVSAHLSRAWMYLESLTSCFIKVI